MRIVNELWFIFLFFHIIKLHICSKYHQFSNISATESPNINISRLVLQSSLSNPLKPGVKLRMQMWLEQRRQAMLQLHSSDQKFHCLLAYKVDRSNQDTIHHKNAVHRSSFVLVSYESVSHVLKNPVFWTGVVIRLLECRRQTYRIWENTSHEFMTNCCGEMGKTKLYMHVYVCTHVCMYVCIFCWIYCRLSG